MTTKLLANTNNKSKSSNLHIYNKLISDLLLKIQKPAQYLGIEWGHLIENKTANSKTWHNTQIHTAIIYPDLYELGMANFGIKILYKIINSYPEYLCDRAYAPMKDMEKLLKENNIPLWGWESFQPLDTFDLLGFSLSYELSYTNVLNILKLSCLELESHNRKEIFPLIFAGGPATFNPEPMAEFIDFFLIGDGEEVIIEVHNIIHKFKTTKGEINKEQLLLQLAQTKGVYVPKFYKSNIGKNYLPEAISDVPKKITKRIARLTDLTHPTNEIVPYLSTVQDRLSLEIRRGCDRGCRFCQPGNVYLPVRERTPDNLLDLSKKALKHSGYDKYSFLSLSASDTTNLHESAMKLNNEHAKKAISLSMPSQRADRFDMTLANELNIVRKSGITLAPEAGTERLRAVINKGLKDNEIKRALENVYNNGFHHVKLYFMIGLPTETFEDLDGIIDLLKWVHNLSKTKKKKPLTVTCTISTFVPKPFTPFQWFNQNSTKEFEEKITYLKQKVKESKLRTVKLNYTDPKIALLETVLSRGDRRTSKLILKAFNKGSNFDAWDEHFNIENWITAGKELNIDIHYEATKIRELGSICPWDIIDTGLLKNYLIREAKKATEVSETPGCTENTCHACGVCFELGVLNEVTEDKSKGKNKYVKESSPQSSIISHQSLVISHLTYPVKSIQKVEIIHTKTDNMRFISHLDIQRLFERALRRAEIPFAFTEGFNPRPKYKWLMPLPLYYESNHEILHLDLSEQVNEKDLQILLNNSLPPEIQVKSIKSIDINAKLPNIENIKVLYKILTYDPSIWAQYIGEIGSEIDKFLTKDSHYIKVLKKDLEKEINIRPCVSSIKILNTNPIELNLVMLGSTRPELILNEISPTGLRLPQEKLQKIWQLNWKITKEGIYEIVNYF